MASENQRSPPFKSTLTSLKAELLDSQTNCATLAAELSRSDSSKPHLHTVEKLAQKLESMQKLLLKLQTQV